MKNKKQNQISNGVFITIGIVILLLIWEISSLLYDKKFVFPDFLVTLNKSLEILSSGEIYLAILTSIGISLLTIFIAFIFAIILGTLSGFFNAVEKILSPAIAIMKVVPTAVISILLLVFVKSTISTFVVIFLIVFPILYEAVLNGIKNIDRYIIMSLKLEGLYKFNSIFKVIIPTILPYIYLGLAQSFGLSMKVEIMSEIIIGSQSIKGLGYLVYLAYAIKADYIELFGIVLITLVTFGILDIIISKVKKIAKN